jgi:hypothetical protein
MCHRAAHGPRLVDTLHGRICSHTEQLLPGSPESILCRRSPAICQYADLAMIA